MFYSLSGKLITKKPQFIVVETNGIGFKVFISSKTLENLPKINSKIKLFCSFIMRQENPEIYGFLSEKELEFFELLISISSVGPKSAMGILGGPKIEKFMAVISQGRADLLSKSWGIGKKKAQRIVLELKDKIKKSRTEIDILGLDFDKDIKSALKNLGYKEKDIESALDNISSKSKKVEEKLKEAIKLLSQK